MVRLGACKNWEPDGHGQAGQQGSEGARLVGSLTAEPRAPHGRMAAVRSACSGSSDPAQARQPRLAASQRNRCLKDRSQRPHHSPRATEAEVVEKIVWLGKHYHFGPAKIAMYLARYHDVTISVSGVWRILKRLGLNRLKTRGSADGPRTLRPPYRPGRSPQKVRNACREPSRDRVSMTGV